MQIDRQQRLEDGHSGMFTMARKRALLFLAAACTAGAVAFPSISSAAWEWQHPSAFMNGVPYTTYGALPGSGQGISHYGWEIAAIDNPALPVKDQKKVHFVVADDNASEEIMVQACAVSKSGSTSCGAYAKSGVAYTGFKTLYPDIAVWKTSPSTTYAYLSVLTSNDTAIHGIKYSNVE